MVSYERPKSALDAWERSIEIRIRCTISKAGESHGASRTMWLPLETSVPIPFRRADNVRNGRNDADGRVQTWMCECEGPQLYTA